MSDYVRGPEHPLYLELDEAKDKYQTVHDHIKALRGKASQYPCYDHCGRQASDWALVPEQDRVGVTTQVLHGRRLAWISNDPADYAPMSRKCHLRSDAMDREAHAQDHWDDDSNPYQ